VGQDAPFTTANFLELIEQKFFACETRIRDQVMQLVTPYKKKSDANFDTCQFLIRDSFSVKMHLEKFD